jgi:hypothetical protein
MREGLGFVRSRLAPEVEGNVDRRIWKNCTVVACGWRALRRCCSARSVPSAAPPHTLDLKIRMGRLTSCLPRPVFKRFSPLLLERAFLFCGAQESIADRATLTPL